MQAVVDISSKATDTGGFVYRKPNRKVESRKQDTCNILFTDDVREDGPPFKFQFQIICVKLMDVIMNLEICFLPPAFSFMTFSFYILTSLEFLHGDCHLPEMSLTLAVAIASITFVILELK